MEKERIYKDAAIMLFSIAGLGIAVGMVLAYALPGYWFPLYPAVPIYFLILAVAEMAVISHMKPTADPHKAINGIVILRGAKLMASIVVIVLYIWLSAVNSGSFLAVFMLFYLVFMGLEVYVLSRYGKASQSKSTNNPE